MSRHFARASKEASAEAARVMSDPYRDSYCLRCHKLPFPPHSDPKRCEDGQRHVVREADTSGTAPDTIVEASK